MHAVAVYGTLTPKHCRLHSQVFDVHERNLPNIKSLPYSRSALLTLFAPLSAQPWAMLLHSGFADHSHNRFDILVAQPRVTLTTQGASTK